MATQLPAPITVTNGPYTATATHEQFGATIQPWNGGMMMYLTVGTVDAAGKFSAIDGVRSDNKQRSPITVQLSADEDKALTGHADWQKALSRAAEMFRFKLGGPRPAWFPA